jgi:V/A-type H+/Na+-transporting ATPase subunit E
MSLDKILEALKAETDQQIAEIERAAQVEIRRIHAKAQVEAVAVGQRHLPEIQVPLRAERARIINQAKLEALRLVMGTREVLIESALDLAASHLAALAGGDLDGRILQELAREASGALGADRGLRLRVQSRDVASMERIARETGLPATVEGGLEKQASLRGSLGGLVAATCDGRISMINTLDARLQRVANLHRSEIAEILLDHAHED